MFDTLTQTHAMSDLCKVTTTYQNQVKECSYTACSKVPSGSPTITERFWTKQFLIFLGLWHITIHSVCATQDFHVCTLSDPQGQTIPASHQFPGFPRRRAQNTLCCK